MKKVSLFPDRKMIKLPRFDILFSPELVVESVDLQHPFPPKWSNGRANLLLLDVLVLESKSIFLV